MPTFVIYADASHKMRADGRIAEALCASPASLFES